ncbi:MAG: hypothetical protein ACLSUO_14435, partial [Lachnospiraceae bacterium]
EKTVPIFHFHEPSTPDFFQQVTEAEVSTRQIIAAAKQYHTTVTVFLVSLLILSIYDAMEPRDRKKAVRIMVPVNLRSYFPSATVRNFFGLIAVTYDRKKQGETLEDVIAAVAENFRRELTKEKLEKMIGQSLKSIWQQEQSTIFRYWNGIVRSDCRSASDNVFFKYRANYNAKGIGTICLSV